MELLIENTFEMNSIKKAAIEQSLNKYCIQRYYKKWEIQKKKNELTFSTHINTKVQKYKQDITKLNLKDDWASREFNEGASGGERKKNELLQLLQAKPEIVLLDEVDTGLDVDALQMVTKIVNEYKSKYGWIVISHNTKILRDLNPTFVHIITNGKIVETSGIELLDRIDKQGFANG